MRWKCSRSFGIRIPCCKIDRLVTQMVIHYPYLYEGMTALLPMRSFKDVKTHLQQSLHGKVQAIGKTVVRTRFRKYQIVEVGDVVLIRFKTLSLGWVQ